MSGRLVRGAMRSPFGTTRVPKTMTDVMASVGMTNNSTADPTLGTEGLPIPPSSRSSTSGPGGPRVSNMLKSRGQEQLMIEEQKMYRRDQRLREYALCRNCGAISHIRNFDRVPSARLGMMTRCIGGKDYSKHDFIALTESERKAFAPLSARERLKRYHYREEHPQHQTDS